MQSLYIDSSILGESFLVMLVFIACIHIIYIYVYQDAVQVMGSDLVACSYASAVRLGLPSRLMI